MAEYIEREAALDAILGGDAEPHYPGWYAGRIKTLPAADVAPVRHGRWENRQGGFWGVATCSVCGEKFPTGEIGLNYCPNCGAKMDGKDGGGDG